MILDFDEHLISVQSKINKTIDRLCKLQNTSPRRALITIYKAFVRPHLDYGNVIYDQAFNELFHQKLEKNTTRCLYSNNRNYLWYLDRENISRVWLRVP